MFKKSQNMVQSSWLKNKNTNWNQIIQHLEKNVWNCKINTFDTKVHDLGDWVVKNVSQKCVAWKPSQTSQNKKNRETLKHQWSDWNF